MSTATRTRRPVTVDTLIATAVRKGDDEAGARDHLAHLMDAHTGDNLAYALVYNGFATELTAYRFIDDLKIGA